MGLFDNDTQDKIDEEAAEDEDRDEDRDEDEDEDEDRDEETQEEADKVDSEEEEKKPAEWDDSTSWVAFIKSLFIYFILTMIFGLFGSSFIYMTTRGSDLDLMLPTDKEFYSAPQFEINKSGPYTDVNCKEQPSGMFAGLEDNFPYNLIRAPNPATPEDLKPLGITGRLTNWFAYTVAGSFKSNRGLLKGWLDNFKPNTPMGNHVFQMYLAMPFTIIVGTIVAFITGGWAAFGAGVSADMKVTVWGGFLLYAWALCFGLAFIMSLRLLGTMCFLPMSENWKEVANIMACNVKPLVTLFGFFVCGSAYDTLDPTVSGVMGIVYLILVSYSLIKYFRSQMN